MIMGGAKWLWDKGAGLAVKGLGAIGVLSAAEVVTKDENGNGLMSRFTESVQERAAELHGDYEADVARKQTTAEVEAIERVGQAQGNAFIEKWDAILGVEGGTRSIIAGIITAIGKMFGFDIKGEDFVGQGAGRLQQNFLKDEVVSSVDHNGQANSVQVDLNAPSSTIDRNQVQPSLTPLPS